MFEFLTNAYHSVSSALTGGPAPAPAPAPPVHHDEPAPVPHPSTLAEAEPPQVQTRAPIAAPAPAPALAAPLHAPAPVSPGAAISTGPGVAPGLEPGAITEPVNPNGPPVANPNQPAPAPDPAKMQAAATQLFKAMDGWGTDEDAIHNALRGKSPAEIAAIRAVYTDHFPGHNLDHDLAGEMAGNDLAEAQAQMTADPVKSAVSSLRNASEGLGTNEDAIHATLAGITDPKIRAQVADQFAKETGTPLTTMLTDELSGGDLAIAQNEAKGDSVGASAARMNDAMNGGFLGLGLGTDEDAVYKALEDCKDKGEREKLAAAYQQQTGRSMASDINHEMSGAELDVASSLQSGDKAGAAAARMQVASDGLGTDEDAIFKTLEGAKSKPERDAMIAAYNEKYGAGKGGQDFNAMLKDEMGEMDVSRATQLAANGKMDPAFALKYAMDGLGTDEDMIKSTLQGKSKEEIKVIKAQYAALTPDGAGLDADLSSENSGRDGFEIQQAMLGEAKTPQEKLARANDAYDFERGSGAGAIGNFVMDNLAGSDAGKVLDAQHARMQELEGRLKAGTMTAEDTARLETVAGYQKDDVQIYQAAQDTATTALATGATIAVGAIVTVATAGTAAPAVIAAVAALAGGTAGMATKALMLGGSYSNEQMGIDAIQTVASAVTAGTLKMDAVADIFGALVKVNPAGAASLLDAVKLGAVYGAAGGLENGIVSGALDERTWRGPGNGLGNFLNTVGTSTLTGTVGGAASGAGGHFYNESVGGVANATNLGGVQATSITGGVIGGVSGAVGSTTTELAIAGAKGEDLGRWEKIVGKYGQAIAGGAISGGADGYAMGVHQQMQIAARELGIPESAMYQDGNPEVLKGFIANAKAQGTPVPNQPTLADQAKVEMSSGKNSTLENTVAVVEELQTKTVPAPIEEAAPVVQHQVEPELTPQVTAEAQPTTAQSTTSTEGRFDHPAYVKEATGFHPEHAEVVGLATLAKTPEEFQFVIDNAKSRGVTLSDEHMAALQHGVTSGDALTVQAMLKMADHRQALGDLHIEARQTGQITPEMGEALRQWSLEARLDTATYLEAAKIHGFDPAEVQKLFELAELTDSQASVDPGTSKHQASDGTALVPIGEEGGLSKADLLAMADVQMHADDDMHASLGTDGKAITDPTGRVVEPTVVRKAVNREQAVLAEQGKSDFRGNIVDLVMGGDVGPRRTTDGKSGEEVHNILGFDYKHESNQLFNPETSAPHDWVVQDGVPLIETPMTEPLKDKMMMPYGSDALDLIKADALDRAANGEYVPGAMQQNGEGDFTRLTTRNRKDSDDPMTGFAYSQTERTRKDGQKIAVEPNNEYSMGRNVEPMGPGSSVRQAGKDGTEYTRAVATQDPTELNADGTPKTLWSRVTDWFGDN